MSQTYYEVLGVERDASFQQLAERFRVLATTFHPQKNPKTMADSNYKFTQICEAFEVLTTRKYPLSGNNGRVAELRESYDRWGEQMLKNGIPGKYSFYAINFNREYYGWTTSLQLLRRSI